MAADILPTPSGARLDPSYAERLARGQLKIARLYVSRAHIALMRARAARLNGEVAVHEHLERAAHWRRSAKARQS